MPESLALGNQAWSGLPGANSMPVLDSSTEVLPSALVLAVIGKGRTGTLIISAGRPNTG